MTIGERIHYFRNLKGMTQKQLGLAVNFPENTADVRVAQYESGKRIPKDDMISKLSLALGVSTSALKGPNIDTDLGVMHTLFLLEDKLKSIITKDDNSINIKIDRDKVDFDFFERLCAWAEKKEQLDENVITEKEYNVWRMCYPNIDLNLYRKISNIFR